VNLCCFNRVRMHCDSHPFTWKRSYGVLTQKTTLSLKLSNLKHKNVTRFPVLMDPPTPRMIPTGIFTPLKSSQYPLSGRLV